MKLKKGLLCVLYFISVFSVVHSTKFCRRPHFLDSNFVSFRPMIVVSACVDVLNVNDRILSGAVQIELSFLKLF